MSSALVAYIYPIYFLSLLAILGFVLVRGWGAITASLRSFSRLDGLAILILLASGLALRWLGTSHIDLDPYGWQYMADALAIRGFWAHGFGATSGLADAVHVPGYSFLLSVPLMIRPDIALVSGYILLFSVLTIGLVYGLTLAITEDRLAAFCAAGLLVTSALHVRYSGQEEPGTISVFFVTLAFFFFILWWKDRRVDLWWAAATAFLLACNIKVENVLWIPFFLAASFWAWPQGHSRRPFYYGLLLIGLSGLVGSYFIANQARHMALIFQHEQLSRPLFQLANIWEGTRALLFGQQKGFAFFMVAGYLMLAVFHRDRRAAMVLAWFVWGLVYFLWDRSPFYVEVCSQQILIPVFVLSGVVVSRACELWKLPAGMRYAVVAVFLLVLATGAYAQTRTRLYSWEDLKKDLVLPEAGACIVSPLVLTSGFALPAIFPDQHWVFEDEGIIDGLDKCEGKIYYFNPLKYGLAEEVTPAQLRDWDAFVQTSPQAFGARHGGALPISPPGS